MFAWATLYSLSAVGGSTDIVGTSITVRNSGKWIGKFHADQWNGATVYIESTVANGPMAGVWTFVKDAQGNNFTAQADGSIEMEAGFGEVFRAHAVNAQNAINLSATFMPEATT